MEKRLIDANAFKKYLKEKFKDVKDLFQTEKMRSLSQTITNDFCRDIDEQPTVDAVPVVHGHWEIVPNGENTDGYYKMRCSVCGEILWSIQSEELYCCKCGAKMDECADGERRTDEQQ